LVGPLVSPFGPAIVAPGPSLGDVVVGTVLGNAVSGALSSVVPHPPSATDRMLQDQQRQDERMIDRQAAEIEALKRELDELQSAPKSSGAPAPVILQVTVPEGKSPGQAMAVKAPDGPTYEVKVPGGLSPGQTFNVQLPAGKS